MLNSLTYLKNDYNNQCKEKNETLQIKQAKKLKGSFQYDKRYDESS